MSWILKPTREEFLERDQEAFIERLHTLHNNTLAVPLNAPEDILLDTEGRVAETKDRLMFLAAKQLCSEVAAGLWKFVTDTGGIVRRTNVTDEMIAPALAIRTINDAIRLRFNMPKGLLGRQMIRNAADNTVDGIVGPGYKYLAHIQLYEAIIDLTQGMEEIAKFHEALLVSRLLSMVFLFDEPLFEYNGVPFYPGYYFRNSEAGEGGVRAGFLLQYGDTRFRCIDKLQSLTHAGKRFVHRLGRMLSTTLLSAERVEYLRTYTQPILDRGVALLDDEVVQEEEYRRLQRVFVDAGIEASFAEVVLNQTIERTENVAVFDIFIETMRVASDLYPENRESLERAAYQILTNRIRLGGTDG
jgi:hypothetical protein